MIFRILICFLMLLTLHGCGGRPVVVSNLPMGIPLADVCDRYHVTWQWDGVTQVVLMEYKGNTSKALVGSSTVLIGKQQIILSAPLRREKSTIYVPQDFEAKVLAPFGVPIGGGLSSIVSSSRVHTIVIDAGHGGKDRGTIAPFGIDEKEIVLDIAKRLRQLLESAGIKVIMTRDSDNFIPLPERTIIASHSGADLFVSIHVNSNHDHSVEGLLVYYLDSISRKDLIEEQRKENAHIYLKSLSANDSTILQAIVADMMDTLKAPQSLKLAKLIVREARDRSGIKVRGDGIRFCRFFVVRNTLMPAVLVETGFLSNRQEHNKLISSLYRQKLAEVIARGVLDYANE
ncbi:MAG: N-acetylmuramoyl-L-alanine amidase [Candidatus Omnitrophica bacterium]|nr:N-acetylmuramoyl-L-alanine amidase [Candidatus Omnitrophota bacterium]